MKEIEFALETIMKQVVQQCNSLVAAATNIDTNSSTIKAMALEFILRELKLEAEKLQKSKGIDGNLLRSIQSFLEIYKKLESLSIDVNLKLSELSLGWKCNLCGNHLAKGASISRLREGAPMVSLKCSACSSFTELTSEGMKNFKNVFDANLKESSWNPRINNFEWNGT